MKRLFDLFFVGAGLLLIWPLILVLAFLVWLVDGRPVFFRQTRIGRGGRRFQMYKFRTMRAESGASITVGLDSRITPLGRRLRRLKLDELPQLFNVLRGEMTLVGPRPEIEEFVALYSPEQRAVLNLLPGITDPASLKYIDEGEVLAGASDPRTFYVETVMPDKIRINLEYARRASILSDLGLILKTVVRSAGL